MGFFFFVCFSFFFCVFFSLFVCLFVLVGGGGLSLLRDLFYATCREFGQTYTSISKAI